MATVLPIDLLETSSAITTMPMLGLLIGSGLIILTVLLVLLLAAYIYSSITMMMTAKRLKVKNPWLAWIPVGNLVLMARMAKMSAWPVLLLLGIIIPFINMLCAIALFVFFLLWLWKICEARKLPGWLAILVLIPGVGWLWGLILWGILAWGK